MLPLNSAHFARSTSRSAPSGKPRPTTRPSLKSNASLPACSSSRQGAWVPQVAEIKLLQHDKVFYKFAELPAQLEHPGRYRPTRLALLKKISLPACSSSSKSRSSHQRQWTSCMTLHLRQRAFARKAKAGSRRPDQTRHCR